MPAVKALSAVNGVATKSFSLSSARDSPVADSRTVRASRVRQDVRGAFMAWLLGRRATAGSADASDSITRGRDKGDRLAEKREIVAARAFGGGWADGGGPPAGVWWASSVGPPYLLLSCVRFGAGLS